MKRNDGQTVTCIEIELLFCCLIFNLTMSCTNAIFYILFRGDARQSNLTHSCPTVLLVANL